MAMIGLPECMLEKFLDFMKIQEFPPSDSQSSFTVDVDFLGKV